MAADKLNATQEAVCSYVVHSQGISSLCILERSAHCAVDRVTSVQEEELKKEGLEERSVPL